MRGSVPTVEAGTGTRFFSDMESCEPPSALSQTPKHGAESLFFWDGGGQRANFMDQFAWNAIKRLGHRAEILAGRDVGEEQPGPEGWGTQVGVLAVPTGEPSGQIISRPVYDIGGYDMRFGTPG